VRPTSARVTVSAAKAACATAGAPLFSSRAPSRRDDRVGPISPFAAISTRGAWHFSSRHVAGPAVGDELGARLGSRERGDAVRLAYIFTNGRRVRATSAGAFTQRRNLQVSRRLSDRTGLAEFAFTHRIGEHAVEVAMNADIDRNRPRAADAIETRSWIGA